MKQFRIAFLTLLIVAVIALIVLYLFTHEIAVLQPAGLIGIKQRNLFYIASLLMLIVVVPTIVLCLVFGWVYRASNKRASYNPEWDESPIGEVIWWCIPFVIIIILGIFTWKTTHELNPFKPIEGEKKPLTIQVVALQWKWLFIYPEEGIATVNYVQFPVARPLRFEITADAPMNSFWIPKLGGQIYAMPAMRSVLNLIADKQGEFRGYSANISGKGFAGMTFLAKATSDAEFEQWVKGAKASSNVLNLDQYKQLATPSEYYPVTLYNLKQDNLFQLIINQHEPGREAL